MKFDKKDGVLRSEKFEWVDHLFIGVRKDELEMILESLKSRFPDADLTKEIGKLYMGFDKIAKKSDEKE